MRLRKRTRRGRKRVESEDEIDFNDSYNLNMTEIVINNNDNSLNNIQNDQINDNNLILNNIVNKSPAEYMGRKPKMGKALDQPDKIVTRRILRPRNNKKSS